MEPIDLFVSSTCYDLVDLRSSLHLYLRERGFSVRLSDYPDSDFEVDPTTDSIASCLNNVEASQAVLCLIDRRYGPILKTGPYAGKSATHAEIEHARRPAAPKPVFIFARDKAWNDYDLLRGDPKVQTRWVEVGRDEKAIEQRARWLSFMQYLAKLPAHASWSNWCDTFKDATDLAPLVLRRLVAEFPQYAGMLAMRPDRMVRMVWFPGGGSSETIGGRFENVGLGAAVRVRHGICQGEVDRPGGIFSMQNMSEVC